MKKIIDLSSCQPAQLKAFLSSSPTNIAVFNDYAYMASYKDSATPHLSESMAIICEFPDQIEVLKDTREIIKTTLTTDNPQSFLDEDLTDKFLSFCTCVQLVKDGNREIESHIAGHGKIATAYFCLIKNETKYITEGIGLLSTSFSDEELYIIKKGNGYTLEIVDKILQNIFLLTNILFERYPELTKPPMDRDTVKCYLFRYSLCCYLLCIRWISGDEEKTFTEDRLRDDIIDMAHVVYATYFDGLLSSNEKVNAIYEEANHLINDLLTLPGKPHTCIY